jgi:hypothetical protein
MPAAPPIILNAANPAAPVEDVGSAMINLSVLVRPSGLRGLGRWTLPVAPLAITAGAAAGFTGAFARAPLIRFLG